MGAKEHPMLTVCPMSKKRFKGGLIMLFDTMPLCCGILSAAFAMLACAAWFEDSLLKESPSTPLN
jgi:hypothetical protein